MSTSICTSTSMSTSMSTRMSMSMSNACARACAWPCACARAWACAWAGACPHLVRLERVERHAGGPVDWGRVELIRGERAPPLRQPLPHVEHRLREPMRAAGILPPQRALERLVDCGEGRVALALRAGAAVEAARGVGEVHPLRDHPRREQPKREKVEHRRVHLRVDGVGRPQPLARRQPGPARDHHP